MEWYRGSKASSGCKGTLIKECLILIGAWPKSQAGGMGQGRGLHVVGGKCGGGGGGGGSRWEEAPEVKHLAPSI